MNFVKLHRHHFLFAVIVVMMMTVSAFAELPGGNSTQVGTSGSNPTMRNGQGNGLGASYYNNGTYLQNNASLNSSTTNRMKTTNDLLWMFTGSDASLDKQVKAGFRSNSDTSFGGRVLNYFLGMVYNRIGVPIANRLGSLENNVLNRIAGKKPAYTNPYGSGNGAAYCYECALQNSTNPYQRNQQAINPAIFNGTTGAGTTSTNRTGTSGGAGGIR